MRRDKHRPVTTNPATCPETSQKIQKAISWNDAFARYLDHIVQIDISNEAPAEQRSRYNNLVSLRGFEENLQGMPLIKIQDTMKRY